MRSENDTKSKSYLIIIMELKRKNPYNKTRNILRNFSQIVYKVTILCYFKCSNFKRKFVFFDIIIRIFCVQIM